MNHVLCRRGLCAALLTALMTQAIFADIHKRITEVTQQPCQLLSRYVNKPFAKAGEKIAPHVPDTHADITLPLLSLALYIASKQIIPAAAKTKGKIAETNPHIKTSINLFNLAVGAASFHDTWKKNDDPIEWTLKNSISTLLMASSSYSIYRTYVPFSAQSLQNPGA